MLAMAPSTSGDLHDVPCRSSHTEALAQCTSRSGTQVRALATAHQSAMAPLPRPSTKNPGAVDE